MVLERVTLPLGENKKKLLQMGLYGKSRTSIHRGMIV